MHAEWFKVATTSNVNLALKSAKQQPDESLTAFIYRWGRITSSKLQCSIRTNREKNKLDLFSSQLDVSWENTQKQ